MELRALSYFLAVAREQNMTEAANVLHVTQPTLSRQIADLEDELGKKLFTRTSRSTVLTEDGMHLRQRAEEILALVSQTEDEMKNDTIDLAGCIRIGAGETHAMHILADLFAELHSRYPRLTVELFTGNADTVEEKLAHGLIDFALMIEPFANAIGIDELLQLDTGHLKFIPLDPALTLSAVVVWKKYRLLSKSSSVFLQELQQYIAEASKKNSNLP